MAHGRETTAEQKELQRDAHHLLTLLLELQIGLGLRLETEAFEPLKLVTGTEKWQSVQNCCCNDSRNFTKPYGNILRHTLFGQNVGRNIPLKYRFRFHRRDSNQGVFI